MAGSNTNESGNKGITCWGMPLLSAFRRNETYIVIVVGAKTDGILIRCLCFAEKNAGAEEI
jgi:hypothetical protein